MFQLKPYATTLTKKQSVGWECIEILFTLTQALPAVGLPKLGF
jgi:hypothetical protein